MQEEVKIGDKFESAFSDMFVELKKIEPKQIVMGKKRQRADILVFENLTLDSFKERTGIKLRKETEDMLRYFRITKEVFLKELSRKHWHVYEPKNKVSK